VIIQHSAVLSESQVASADNRHYLQLARTFTAKPPGTPSWFNKDAKPVFLAILGNSWRPPCLGG